MRIIYVENVRIPSERAHALQIVQTCSWLARFGAEVTLVNPARSTENVFAYFHLPQNIFTHVRLSCVDALAWKWFPSKAVAYSIQRWSFAFSLKRWAMRQQADVWYTRDPAMADLLKGQGKRIVLELHDRPDHQPARWERIKPHVTSYVSITKGLKDILVGLGIEADRISVSPDGYDPEEFKQSYDRNTVRQELGIPNDAFVSFYAGGFYPWKGVDVVVSAWNKTGAKHHLVLIGGPKADRERLLSLIAPEVHERVHVMDYRPHADIVRLMAAADVGLLTTSPKEEIGRSFTSPLKQFEFLAAGLPILASEVPSSHEVLTEEVARFFTHDETSFVQALEMLASDSVWLSGVSMRSMQLVSGFTWEERTRIIFESFSR